MALRRVVVTGLGALTPIGNNTDEYWQSLITGKSGCGLITKFDTTLFKTKIACELKGFDPTNYIDKKEIKRMDFFTQYAMAAATQAIEDAQLNAEGLDKDRIGVIWSSGIGGLDIFQEELEYFYANGKNPRFNPFFIPKMIIDIAAGMISMKYGFRGPNYAPVAACASSTIALINAYDFIRLGKCDAILAGGSEAPITYGGVGGFSAMKALSERNDDPATASRPYDKDRDGFVMGEGAGAIVVESLEHALARGAKIYCELVGTGLSADAYHLTAPHPEGAGAIKVMQYTLAENNVAPSEIDYINTHGTSTPLGDVAELKAIEVLLGEHISTVNISSTKSMTGHLLGAAGAIESIACIKAVEEDIVPPTINHFTDDETINPAFNLTFNKAQKRTINYALSNTFGFGGHNAAVLFKKYV